MTIELVHEKDCVIGSGKGKGKIGSGDSGANSYKGTMLKKITNRDRRRCFTCGHNEGQWFEYLDRGRRVYHFLCRSCIDTIENNK
jgi:late competence protein required for DNA uptake (superfamily II DNA/RNA helicase)